MRQCIRSGAILLVTTFLFAALATADGLQRAPEPQWPHGDPIKSSLSISTDRDRLDLQIDGTLIGVIDRRLTFTWLGAPHYEDYYIPFAYEPYDYRYGHLSIGPTYRTRNNRRNVFFSGEPPYVFREYDVFGLSLEMSKLFENGWYLQTQVHPKDARGISDTGFFNTANGRYSSNSIDLIAGRHSRSYQIGTGVSVVSQAGRFGEAMLFLSDAATIVSFPLEIEVTPTSYSRYRFMPVYRVADSHPEIEWLYEVPFEFWLTTPVYWTELFIAYTFSNNDKSLVSHFLQLQFKKYFEQMSVWADFSMYRKESVLDTETLFIGGGCEGNNVIGEPGVQLTINAGYRIRRFVGTDDFDEAGWRFDAALKCFFRE